MQDSGNLKNDHKHGLWHCQTIHIKFQSIDHPPTNLDDFSISSMGALRSETYMLHVGSADMNAWSKSRSKKKSPNLYVEIKLEESVIQKTGVIERKKAPSWNEEFKIFGSGYSIISLLIKDHNWLFGGDTCVGRVDILLSNLLASCASNTYAVLRVKPATAELGDQTMGTITVKIRKLADFDDSMSTLEKAVALADLGARQGLRFQRQGKLNDLQDSISNLQQAVELTNDGHPEKPGRLSNLGNSQHARFEQLGDLSDLDNAISNKRKAVELTDNKNPALPIFLSNLGNGQRLRFERLGEVADLEDSISNMQRAIKLIDGGDPRRATYLLNLGISQRCRFESFGNVVDLENAILNYRESMELTDDAHPDKPHRLSNLSKCQALRFDHLGKLTDLEDAILNSKKAVELMGDGHPDASLYLSNLGNNQHHHFKRLGMVRDIHDSISNLQRAVDLIDDGHLSKPGLLSNLGSSQQLRFERLGQLVDLEQGISNERKAVELMDDRHPDKPGHLSNLGVSQHRRFEHLGIIADLDDSISNQQEAVSLTGDGNPDKPKRLSNLGGSQCRRFEHLGRLGDLEDSISNLQHAITLTGDAHPDKPRYFTNLGSGLQRRFKALGELADLRSSVLNKQKAVELTNDGHPNKKNYLANLGNGQQARFERLGELSDLENAISNFQLAVELTDNNDVNKPRLFSSLGCGQRVRFERLGELPDIENSISNLQRAVELTDNENPDKPDRLSNLGVSQYLLLQHLGKQDGIRDSISNLKLAVELTGDRHPAKPMYLSNLGCVQPLLFEHCGALSDLEESIFHLQQAVELTDDRNVEKPGRLMNLGINQQCRFEHLGELSDLESSISNFQLAINLSDEDHPHKAVFLLNFGESMILRFECIGHHVDLVASVSAFKAAAQSRTAYPRHALSAARKWAETSRRSGDIPSALDGYRTALEILPKVAWLGLDAPSHHEWLLREKSENLGCLSATCAIQLGQFEEAVELLDLGRSVFWQQASSLRPDLEALRTEEPELAKQLESVGWQLDAGYFSGSFLINESQNAEFNRIKDVGKERRRLVGVWEGLVDEVRKRPNFQFFLRPIPFHRLRQAATTGHVVIINISQYGVDSLIFDATQPIQHMPLSSINVQALTQLAGNAVLNRSMDVDARATQRQKFIADNLQIALRKIWYKILVPIFNKIHVPLDGNSSLPQHRVWWYPTGPLTFIPIHAAGPGKGAPDVSRMVISSYVTTLNSLYQAQQKYIPPAAGRLKLLAISQPETLGQNALPHSTEEVEKLVQVARSSGWSGEDILHLSGSDATVGRVSGALDTCSWAHFACHGSQDSGSGMKSAFALHDGRLELGKIASKRLSSGQFAFLSVCHAASGIKDLPGEAKHLAAGLQFAGFPSVIATMWSIRDDDAPKVAEHTYQYLFRNGLRCLDPSEAAMALNCAVLRLREDPEISVDRWAPFIHFGI